VATARLTKPGRAWAVAWLSVVLVVACAQAAAGSAGEYRSFEVESLRIEFDSEWAMLTAPGYVPVRLDITNVGDARVIEIFAQGTRYFRSYGGGMSGGATEISQRVRLARGDRVRLTIPVPVFGANENFQFEIREEGRTLERLNYLSFQSATAPAGASALIVADRAGGPGAEIAGWARLMSASLSGRVMGGPVLSSGSAPAAPPLDLVLAPSRLPTNWLGYTSLRAVIIQPPQWAQLTEPQKTAILTWTACGGDLVFVDGDATTLVPNLPVAGPAADAAVRGYFFGRIHTPTSASITASGLAAFLTSAQRLQDSNLSLPANGARDWGSIAARGFRLPIPGVDGIPARAYVGILLVFSVIIGPANYWFLRRARLQVLLVLTAPLIAAVFIVLLAGYVVAGEGFGVRGRIASFTMLDQVRSQAVTRSSLSLYAAGMTPSQGLRVPRDVAVFPLGTEGTGVRDRLVLDLTDGQRFADGVIHARSPTNLEQVAFRPARERLAFAREGGEMTVVNGLGASIAALIYRDGQTVYSLAGSLASGGKATLKAGVPGATAIVPSSLPLTARFVHLVHNQPAGSYLAVLDASPFVEPGVAGVAERGSFHLVLGWPAGQP
jgi:hypothetical protein